MHPRSITARPWKMVVGRRSFPIGKVIFRGELLNFQEGIVNFDQTYLDVSPPWHLGGRQLSDFNTGAKLRNDLNTWLLNWIFCPETSSLTVWFCMTTSAKERSFWRKSCIFLPMFFSLFCHPGRDFTRTNTTAVQVGRMSWLVVKTKHSFKKTTVFFSFKLFELFGRSKAPFFKRYKWNGSNRGKFPWTNCLKSRRSQVLNLFLKTYFRLTYTLRDSTHEIGGWTNWVLGFCLG